MPLGKAFCMPLKPASPAEPTAAFVMWALSIPIDCARLRAYIFLLYLDTRKAVLQYLYLNVKMVLDS